MGTIVTYYYSVFDSLMINWFLISHLLIFKIFTICFYVTKNTQLLVTCSSFLLTAAGSFCIYKIICIHSRTQCRHTIYTQYYPHIDYANKNSCQLISLFYHLLWWVRKSVNWGQRSQTREISPVEWPKTWDKDNIEIKYISKWILSLIGLLTQDSTRSTRQGSSRKQYQRYNRPPWI